MTAPAKRFLETPALRTVGNLAGHHFFYGLLWVGVIALVAVSNIAPDTASGEVEASVWEISTIMIRYGLLATGIMIVYNYLPLFVAHGVTRRSFFTGAVSASLFLVLLVAAAATAVFWVEGLVYDAAGWANLVDDLDGRHFYARPDEYAPIFGVTLAVFVAHLVTGMLIGAAYYRYGGFGGTVFLPVAVLPAVACEFALRDNGVSARAFDGAFGLRDPSAAVGVPVSIATIGLGLAAAFALVRAMPIRSEHAVWWR